MTVCPGLTRVSHVAVSKTDHAADATRGDVPHLLPCVHDGAREQLWRLHEEPFRQVHRPLELVHLLPLPARCRVSTHRADHNAFHWQSGTY